STEFNQLRAKVSAARVASRLPARTALVEFLFYRHYLPRAGGGRRLLAFVVRGDRAPVLLEVDSADRIRWAVAAWRQTGRGSAPDAASVGLLRKTLWQPVAKHLGGIDTVLIAPDGELAGLPFAALPGEAPGSFLLEQYTFGYLTSGRQLLLP